jgi:DNA-binding HxlR family transcriptional regulator
MRDHEAGSEPGRTATFPASMTELEAFRLHDAVTRAFTDALREGRCRRTDRFTTRLSDTVGALRPLVGPWNLEILFALHVHGPQRFSALKRGLAGVSSRVLTDKLRALEGHGLVARSEAPGAVSYALTPQGEVVARHLHPIVFYLRNRPGLR